jgi:hypothetical protein
MATLMTSPRMARDRLLYGWLAAKGVAFFERVAIVNEGFTGRYSDGWIGPIFREKVSVPKDGKRLLVTVSHQAQQNHRSGIVKMLVNGKSAESKTVEEASTFALACDVTAYHGEFIEIEIRTNFHFVPSDQDTRHLSIQLHAIKIE